MRSLLVLAVVWGTLVSASWCALEFDAAVSRRTLGRVCELLGCTSCDDACVGRRDATTLVVADAWLWRLDALVPAPAIVNCSFVMPDEDPPLGDSLVLFLFPGGGDTARRVSLWSRAFPACSFTLLPAPSAVYSRGCTWEQLRPIHGSIMMARARHRAKPAGLSAGTGRAPPALQNRWSVNRAGLPVDGTGQVIGTIDTGASLASCYLRDHVEPSPSYFSCGVTGAPPPTSTPTSNPTARKVVQYVRSTEAGSACGVAGDTAGHGTHTAGTLAGDPLCASTCPDGMGDFSGVARRAKLAVFDAGPDSQGYLVLPDDISLAYAWATRAGAAVHSDSWGADSGGYYSDLDYTTDAWMAQNPEALVVAAAGNNGDDPDSPFVQSPGLSKNALTVGAAYSSADARTPVFCGSLAYAVNPSACAAIGSHPEGATVDFSARGSRSGAGRIKPDVMAPGDVVWSALNVNQCGQRRSSGAPFWDKYDLQPMMGTSMATPIVAGLAALVRQYFSDGFYPCNTSSASRAWPFVSSALVRAVLVLAAEAASPALPRGYGSLVRLNALLSGGEGGVRVLGGASPQLAMTGAVHVYTLCATSSTVRAALAWTDPPSFVNDPTSGLLVNDLDLVAVVGSAARLGNGFRDSVSTLEALVLTNVPVGATVTIQVLARRVLGLDPQSYALVVSGADPSCGANSTACPATTPTLRSTVVSDVALVVDSLTGYAVLVAQGVLGSGATQAFELQVVGPDGVYYASVPSDVPPDTLCGVPSYDWPYGPFVVLRGGPVSATLSLSFSATPSGRMYWRSQRVYYCANRTGSVWEDVTTSTCVERTQPESDAPVRVCGRGPANGTYVLVDVHDESRWDVECATGGWSGCTCKVPHRWGYWGYAPVAFAVFGGAQFLAVVYVDSQPGGSSGDFAGLALAVAAFGRFSYEPAAVLLALTCIPILLVVVPIRVHKAEPFYLVGGVALAIAASVLELTLGEGEDPSVALAVLVVPAAIALVPPALALGKIINVPQTAFEVPAALVFAGAGAASLQPALVYATMALVLIAPLRQDTGLVLPCLCALLCAFVYLFAPCSDWPWK